jgi:hypothetical protein
MMPIFFMRRRLPALRGGRKECAGLSARPLLTAAVSSYIPISENNRSPDPHPMKKIEIYTSPFCGFCFRAKSLLDAKGVAYEEIDARGELDTKLGIA